MGQEGQQPVIFIEHDVNGHPDGIDEAAVPGVIEGRINPHRNRKALIAGGVAVALTTAGAAAFLAHKLHEKGNGQQ